MPNNDAPRAPETRAIDLLLPDSTVAHATLLLQEKNASDDWVGLSLLFDGGTIEYWAENYWFCLQMLRLELEDRGIALVCYGASKNVHPSGMQLGMGTGDMAYKLSIGIPARSDTIVSIFEAGKDIQPATIAEQESYYRQWLESLQAP